MSLLGHLKPKLELPEQLFWLEDATGPFALTFKDADGIEEYPMEMVCLTELVNAIYKHHHCPDPDDPQGWRESYQQILWFITGADSRSEGVKIVTQRDNLEQVVLFGINYITDIHDELSRIALEYIRQQKEA